MGSIRSLLKIALFTSLLAAARNDLGASSLEIKGNVAAIQTFAGRAFATNAFWFEAILGPTGAVIRTEGPHNSIESVEIGQTERHCYLMVRFDTNKSIDTIARIGGGKSTEIKPAQPITPENSAQLIISDGLLPPPGYGIATPAWMAYGSSDCFGNEPRRLSPIFPLGADVDFAILGGKGEVRSKTNGSPPFLLSELVQQFDSREWFFREFLGKNHW